MSLKQVKNEKGEWVQVIVPKSIKAIVLLNLQSYAGGRDLWGLKDAAKDNAKGWQVPIFNDGLIEVICLCRPFEPSIQFKIVPCATPVRLQTVHQSQ